MAISIIEQVIESDSWKLPTQRRANFIQTYVHVLNYKARIVRMSRFHVFLGAPTARDIQRDRDSASEPSKYHWVHSSPVSLDPPPSLPTSNSTQPVERKLLSAAEFESASQHISKLYATLAQAGPRSRDVIASEWTFDRSEKWGQNATCLNHLPLT